MAVPDPLHVAIIGAGPAGFFAADALLKRHDEIVVDLYDRLPAPYGLVRYGVAPDHQKIKAVTRTFEKTASDSRLRFFGNVSYGSDLTRSDLERHYHAVIFTVGASSDRQLGIPGEGLAGSLSATEFVAWYNGHPDYRDATPPLDAERVTVVGMGNVAVDVTRVLAKHVDELARTDIADHALEALAESRVQEIVMLGRRGPAQGKFTTKELRELGELEHADIVVERGQLVLDAASAAAAEDDRGVARNIEILRGFADQALAGKPRRVVLRFLASPLELLGDSRVEAMRIGENQLRADTGGYLKAVPTGREEQWTTELVLRSVGYRGVALPELPFDARRGVLPNREGRIIGDDGEPLLGLYAAGWIKRGPTGVIGTNKADAAATVTALLVDAERGALIDPAAPAPGAPLEVLRARGVRAVDFGQWEAIDRHERDLGAAQGRPRVKVVALNAMLAAAQSDG